MENSNRRTFLQFLGKGIVGTVLVPTLITGCNATENKTVQKIAKKLKSLAPSSDDVLSLADGFNFDILVKWGESISEKDTFGFNNDFTAFIPSSKNNSEEGILWVNHEYIQPLFVSGFTEGVKTKEEVEKEMYDVGGSLIKIKKDKGGKWNYVKNDPHNRRLNGFTKIPFNWPEKIAGADHAIGTLANCSGGVTPWGTILTCEENYDMFYCERNHEDQSLIPSLYDVEWYKHYPYPPEHYGWVVEVDPKTGAAQKHIALGRCAHECATMKELEDGRLIVYTGDDANDECFYKFIGSKKGSLSEGTLYVANTEKGEWASLKYEDQKILQENFKNQTEVLIRLREASKLVGGTPLDRPEDIEIDPITGNVLVSLTNNIPKENYFGAIMKLEETDGKFDSLTFKADTYLAGGAETGFACPDNMAFDTIGNLWFTSDISGSKMNKPPYEAFKNNGLFVVPRNGDQAGKVIQIASAPTDAELTGPFFSPDGKTLFLSVQHPGERSTSLAELTSHWPEGGTSIPKPTVVAISGEGLNGIQGIV